MSSGPWRRYMGILHHAPSVRPSHSDRHAERTDMSHADHALPHVAPAFPGAGSCLERGCNAQHHSPAVPPVHTHHRCIPPRQVSELCTFRLHTNPHSGSVRGLTITQAVRAHVARPPTAWPNVSPAIHTTLRMGWPPCCTARGTVRRLSGDSDEFPCLASRAARRMCLGRLT